MANGDHLLDRLTSIDDLLRKLLSYYPISVEVPAKVEVPATFTTIPLDPETLNNLIEAQRLGRGTYKTMTYQVSVLIPSNDTKTRPLLHPEGLGLYEKGPAEVAFLLS